MQTIFQNVGINIDMEAREISQMSAEIEIPENLLKSW